jgi:hypothetical protein
MYKLVGFEMSPRNTGYAFDGRQCGINSSQQCYYVRNTFTQVTVDIPKSELDLTCPVIIGNGGGAGCGAVVEFMEGNSPNLSIIDHTADRNATLREMLKIAPNNLSYVALLNKSDRPEYTTCGRYNPTHYYTGAPQGPVPVYLSLLHSTTTCSPVKPTPTWCAFSEGSTKLDFNTVMMSEWKGSRASTHTKIYCSGKTSYKLHLLTNSANSSVGLSNGGVARITVNGSPLGSSLTGLAGEQPVEVVAQLDGTPVNAGPFSGTDVLRVSYN